MQASLLEGMFSNMNDWLSCTVLLECSQKDQDQKALAEGIKKAVESKDQFQSVPGKGPWQCIVGGSFSAAVSHEHGHSAIVRFPTKGLTV